MASRTRPLLEPTDDWQQLQFQLDWPEQTRYELIRPVVVFGSAPVERGGLPDVRDAPAAANRGQKEVARCAI